MQPKFFSYPLCEAVDFISSAFSIKSKFEILKVFLIEFPNILLMSLLLSNFVTDVSLIDKVDCAEVSLLKNSAFVDINKYIDGQLENAHQYIQGGG